MQKNSILSNSVILSFSTIILVFLGVVAQSFLSNYLSVYDYGIFQLLISWIGLFSFLSLSSFNTIVTKTSAQNYKRFYITASKICFIFSILGSLAYFILSYLQQDLRTYFITLAMLFPLYSGINLTSSYLVGVRKYVSYSIYVLVQQLFTLVFQIYVLVLNKGLLNLLLATLAVTAILNLFSTLYLSYRLRLDKKNLAKEKELISYGVNLTLLSFLGSAASKIQFMILNAFSSPESLAIYFAAQLIPEKMKTLFKSFFTPINTYLASIDKKNALKIIKKITIPLIIFGFLNTIFLIFIFPVAIRVIYGNKYESSIIYTMFLSLFYLAWPYETMTDAFLIFHGYKKFYTKVTVIKNVSKIVLYLALIPTFKIWGIIIATVFSVFLSAFINYLFLNKKKPVKTHKVFSTNDCKFSTRKLLEILTYDELESNVKYPLWIRLCFLTR